MEQDTLHIVMECADAGSLDDRIKERRKSAKPFSMKQLTRAFAQLVMAVAAMHGANILHRDLKPANVFLKRARQRGVDGPLIDEDGEHVLDVKLGDFGLSRTLKSQELAQSITGTPFYMSPELWHGKPYGRPADIWVRHIFLALANHVPALLKQL